MQLILFVAGLVCLILGAELLVRGASSVARSFGISSLTVGLTVVAFGTSAPELAVSIKAALSGQSSIAVGNVIGSNTFNVLFILGVSALICPLVVSIKLIRIDVPLMIVASVLALLLAWDGSFDRFDGLLLFSGLVCYTVFLFFDAKNQKDKQSADMELAEASVDPVSPSLLVSVSQILVGLFLLVLGSRWLVNSAVVFAEILGVDELIISLTIVAAGTSLPEVVTSLVASVRGERDIAVGNVVGSNLFNLLGVLGLAAVIAPASIDVGPSVVRLDLPLMIAVAFACLPIFFTGGVISRWEGAMLFGYYIAYTVYLVLTATRHEALGVFTTVMLCFVIPITVVTLGVVTIQALRRANVAPGNNDETSAVNNR